MKKKKTLFWILAVVITVAAAIYQRQTGPTYPKEVEVKISGKKHILELPRSQSGTDDFFLKIDLPDPVKGKVFYRRYPTGDEWSSSQLKKKEDGLAARLPGQPPAGKLEYYLGVFSGDQLIYIAKNKPIRIRFKGEVPRTVLIPHIIIMFLAMLFSTLAGLFAFGKIYNYRLYGYITLILLVAGGFILGPLMQYHAFGDAWTGIPFGWDLTDNKTLIAFIGWLTAILANRKVTRPRYYVFAAILLLVVYSIPHSVMGSEYDYEKGEVVTGFIQSFYSHLLMFRSYLIC